MPVYTADKVLDIGRATSSRPSGTIRMTADRNGVRPRRLFHPDVHASATRNRGHRIADAGASGSGGTLPLMQL